MIFKSSYCVPSILLIALLHASSPVVLALLLDSTDIISIFYMKKLGYGEI